MWLHWCEDESEMKFDEDDECWSLTLQLLKNIFPLISKLFMSNKCHILRLPAGLRGKLSSFISPPSSS